MINTLNSYLRDTFGEKVYKLSIDLGLSCPNRDGTLGTRGCIFCHNGSSHFASTEGSVAEKLERAKEKIAQKSDAKKFIAYFQSFTNTYGDIDFLRESYTTAIERDDICAISIATRPDCLSDEVLSLLYELNRIKPVWVELGLQTSNEQSAEYIRRCYKNDVYKNAVKALREGGIEVITHLILGLPNETVEDMLNSVDFAVECGTTGIKLQLLHILRGTDLCDDFLSGRFSALSLEEYIDILFKCIERIPENIVLHRITGDAPKAHLVAPLWSGDKKNVLNTINRELKARNIRQGSTL